MSSHGAAEAYARERGKALAWSIPILIMLLAWGAAISLDTYPSDRAAASLLIGTVLLGGWAVLSSHPEGQWSVPFLGYVALSLFHIGLFIAPALSGATPGFLLDTDPSWFYGANLGLTASLLALGFLCYALGAALPVYTRRTFIAHSSYSGAVAVKQRRSISTVGSAVLIVSVTLWFVENTRLNGPLFFLGSYADYLDAVEGSLVGICFMGIGLGLVMCVQWIGSWIARVGILSFAVFAILGFPLGLRGEVLMPLVAATGVFMKMVYRRPKWLLVVGSFLVLAFITVGRQVRALGLGDAERAEVSIRLLDAIEEMGASMRVLATSVQWHTLAGEPYAGGSTYITPIIRNVRSVLGLPNLPVDFDYGLFNVEIAARVGNIGGSVIGEAHHNFGTLGVIFVPVAWGFLLAALNGRARSPWGVAFLGTGAMLFLMHVRNASTPLFMWACAAGVLLLLSRLLSSAQSSAPSSAGGRE